MYTELNSSFALQHCITYHTMTSQCHSNFGGRDTPPLLTWHQQGQQKKLHQSLHTGDWVRQLIDVQSNCLHNAPSCPYMYGFLWPPPFHLITFIPVNQKDPSLTFRNVKQCFYMKAIRLISCLSSQHALLGFKSGDQTSQCLSLSSVQRGTVGMKVSGYWIQDLLCGYKWFSALDVPTPYLLALIFTPISHSHNPLACNTSWL